MKLKTVFISRTKQNYTKPVTISERASKIKVILSSTLFPNFAYVSSYLSKKLLHKNDIVHFFQNYKGCQIKHGLFRKPSQSSTNSTKIYPKMFRTLFTFVHSLATFNV